MSTTVTYKGNTLTTVNNETKSLLTAGTWLEDDIEITDASSGGSGTALIVDTTDSHGGIIREITTDTEVKLQGRKTVTPTSQTQIITADTGYDGIVEVEVAPGTGGVANIYQDENGVLILDSEPTEVGEWKRPLDWMPYADGWDDEDFEGCYFVYDLAENDNEDFPYPWAVVANTNPTSAKYVVDKGYIDNMGIFDIVETTTYNNNVTADGWLPFWNGEESKERFYVVRVTPESGVLTRVAKGRPNTNFFPSINANYHYYAIPLIEMYGNLPNVTDMSSFCNSNKIIHAYLLNCKPTTLLQAFANDALLEKVDGMKTWDTSNCTTMGNVFQYCSSLVDLSGIEDWDVSNSTSFNYAFANHKSNRGVLNLSKWTLKANAVLRSMCSGGYFRKIYFPKTANNEFQNAESAFSSNERAKEIILQDTFKTQFPPFSECRTLRKVDMNHLQLIDCTSLSQAFINDFTLSEVDFRGQDTSKVTTTAGMFQNCHSLSEINFTGCDFSAVTNTATNQFYACYGLRRLIGFTYYKSFSIAHSDLFTATTLNEVISNLPIVTSTQTLTLGTTNKNKLTAEQIAIATEKGWTVA